MCLRARWCPGTLVEHTLAKWRLVIAGDAWRTLLMGCAVGERGLGVDGGGDTVLSAICHLIPELYTWCYDFVHFDYNTRD